MFFGLLPGCLTAAHAADASPMQLRQVPAYACYVQGVSALDLAPNGNHVANISFVVTPSVVSMIGTLGSPFRFASFQGG
jgi:hypothetical protein